MISMKNYVRNSCGKRGCRTIILTHDSIIKPVLSRVHGASNDISKVLPLANLSLDKKLAQEGQMEKMAA